MSGDKGWAGEGGLQSTLLFSQHCISALAVHERQSGMLAPACSGTACSLQSTLPLLLLQARGPGPGR